MPAPPDPWDVQLGGFYWKLATDDGGNLRYTRKPTPFFPDRVSQGAATQAQFPPDARLPYTFGKTSGGFGLSRHDTAEDTDRYHYTGGRDGALDEGVDPSLGDRSHLGPQHVRVTLSGFTPTDGYFFALGTGWYLAATDGTNTRVYKWNTLSEGWDLQATIASRVVTDATVFRGTQAQPYAYLAFGAVQKVKYSTDAITWTDVGSAAGQDTAVKFAKIDGELWRVVDGTVDKASNGGTAPTYGGPIDVGDNLGSDNGLYNVADRLAVGRSVGWFVLAGDRNTLEQNLWPDLWENGPDTATFAGGIAWRNHLIVRVKQGLAAIGPDTPAQVAYIGWDRLLDNASPVAGAPSGLTGDHFHLYGTAASGELMKGVAVHGAGGAIADVKWHPILSLGTTSRRSAVWNGAAGGAPQMFLLLATGQVGRIVLPVTGNPLTDPRCRFAAGGVQYRPVGYLGYIAIDKLAFTVTGDGERFSTTATVTYGLRVPQPDGGAFAELAPPQTADPGQVAEVDPPKAGRALEVAETFETADQTASPVLRSTTLTYLVQPDALPTVQMVIDCRQGALLADGSAQLMEPATAADRLSQMVNSGVYGHTDPWGRSLDVTIGLDGDEETAGKRHTEGQPDLFVTVVARAQKQRRRGTWDQVTQYTWDELAERFTWDNLPLLA